MKYRELRHPHRTTCWRAWPYQSRPSLLWAAPGNHWDFRPQLRQSQTLWECRLGTDQGVLESQIKIVQLRPWAYCGLAGIIILGSRLGPLWALGFWAWWKVLVSFPRNQLNSSLITTTSYSSKMWEMIRLYSKPTNSIRIITKLIKCLHLNTKKIIPFCFHSFGKRSKH